MQRGGQGRCWSRSGIAKSGRESRRPRLVGGLWEAWPEVLVRNEGKF